LAGLTLLSPVYAAAGASDWTKTEQTEVRLISASTTTGGADSLQLGVQFRLQPHWKVYWRSPGDAGFPPQLDWAASSNIAEATVLWPAPERFSVLGLETLGYQDEVVFPVRIRPQSRDGGVTIQADLRYLTCNDICIPYETTLSLALPAGPQQPSEFAHLINQYRSTVPGNGQIHGLRLLASRVNETENSAVIRIAVTSSAPLVAPDAYFEGPREVAFSKPNFRFGENRQSAVLEVKADGLSYLEDSAGKTINGRSLTVTLVDGSRSAEQVLTLGDPLLTSDTPPQIPVASGSRVSILAILAIAVLGGLILNFMPCVLPVLSIKVLGVVGHGGGENRFVRLSFMASAAGIIASFLLLAGALAALKSGGMAVGWGVQFQYPWFLIGMAFLVVLFACNLWGFFEVRLPGTLAQLGAPTTGDKRLTGHFLQGALATLLATPCSAPFLGTAIGFALARGTTEIFAIFLALGIGMALPFLAFALAPSLITRLPRPGAWMVRLRFVLGFALAATAAWLITILVPSVGQRGAGIVAAAMITIVGLLYFAHQSKNGIGKANWMTVGALLVLALYAPGKLAPDVRPLTIAESSENDAIKWQPFDLAAIESLTASGHTVLVDVTADWCITCKVNKALVFSDGPVATLMDRPKFIAMQADWTLPSPTIAAYLASFGRYGIPFNAVYGPQSPEGIALSELLSETDVMAALAEASGDVAIAQRTK